MSLLFFALLLVCAGTLAGQEKTETQKQTNDRIEQLAEIARAHPVDTPIGTGDLLHIDVFDIPELSRDVRVSDVGDISFPLVPGRIPAAGLTPFQLEEKLEQLLIDNGLVTHPQVSVFVREQNSQPVSVVGAVNKPMVYQVIRPTSLLEILADAGGISDDAGSVVLITRPARPGAEKTEGSADATPSSPDSQTITIRLQDLLDSGDPSYNIQVFGGDAVSVPRAGIIYVTGAGVAQPGGYVLQSHGEQITTMKAVALAHGLTSYAKADDAVILRTNPLTGQKDQIPVHLKQIQNRKAEDIPMKSNDILYIPDSVGLKVLAKGAEAAVGVSSGVIVYRAGTR
ncbi:MAG: polysaccharide biosynthesis/export family protein [Candidatus Acidiferrales bacterium]